MKKVITIIFCLLCALTASAVSYATPYMGSGRGFIHTTSSAHVHSIGNGGGGLASAPVATMGSVNGRGVSSSTVASTRVSYSLGRGTSTPHVHSGIYTSASAISGGVTTEETGHHHGGGVKTSTPPPPPSPSTPGYCEHCHYVWVEIDDPDDPQYPGYWVCSECGRELQDGCNCTDECHCVPLDEEWHVWLFVSLIAAIYALIKVKRERLAVKRETI